MGIVMSSIIFRKFHPLVLLLSFGIFFLIILNLNNNTALVEKIFFLVMAGSIYFIAITFEAWRINQK